MSSSDLIYWVGFMCGGAGILLGYFFAFLASCFDKTIVVMKEDQIVVNKGRYESLEKFYGALSDKVDQYDLEFD